MKENRNWLYLLVAATLLLALLGLVLASQYFDHDGRIEALERAVLILEENQ